MVTCTRCGKPLNTEGMRNVPANVPAFCGLPCLRGKDRTAEMERRERVKAAMIAHEQWMDERRAAREAGTE